MSERSLCSYESQTGLTDPDMWCTIDHIVDLLHQSISGENAGVYRLIRSRYPDIFWGWIRLFVHDDSMPLFVWVNPFLFGRRDPSINGRNSGRLCQFWGIFPRFQKFNQCISWISSVAAWGSGRANCTTYFPSSESFRTHPAYSGGPWNGNPHKWKIRITPK